MSTFFKHPSKSTQRSILHPKVTFDIPGHTERHLYYTGYSELDDYEEKESEWRAKEVKSKKIKLDYSSEVVGLKLQKFMHSSRFEPSGGLHSVKVLHF